jgi:hypothetical protein
VTRLEKLEECAAVLREYVVLVRRLPNTKAEIRKWHDVSRAWPHRAEQALAALDAEQPQETPGADGNELPRG